MAASSNNTLGSPSETFKEFVVKIIDEITINLRESSFSENSIDYASYGTDQLISIVSQGVAVYYISTDVVDFLLVVLKNLDICAARQENQRIHVNLVHTGCAGRPSYNIGEDLLRRFLGEGFSCKDIADILGVCTKIVFRRMRTFNLDVTNPNYTEISSNDLEQEVRNVIKQFPPGIGIRMVKGHLFSQGIKSHGCGCEIPYGKLTVKV